MIGDSVYGLGENGLRQCVRGHWTPIKVIERVTYLIILSFFLIYCDSMCVIIDDQQVSSSQVLPFRSSSSSVSSFFLHSSSFSLDKQNFGHRYRRLADEQNKHGRLRILPGENYTQSDTRDILRLVCQGVDSDPNNFTDFQWFDNQDRLITHAPGRFLTPDKGELSLLLQNQQISDSGVYRCSAVFQGNIKLNASIKVALYRGIEFDDCPSEQFLIAGKSDGKIICKVSSQPPPRITWKKAGKPLDTESFTLANDAISVKGPITPSAAGLYILDAAIPSFGRGGRRMIRVEVGEIPVISETDSNKEITEGERTALQCKATGIPPPLYYFFDSTRRDLSSQAGYHVDTSNGLLTIDSVHKDRDGKIECQVANKAGKDSRMMELNIMSKPSLIMFQNESMIEGGPGQLSCKVRGHPLPKVDFVRLVYSPNNDHLDERPLSQDDRFRFETREVIKHEVEQKLIISNVKRMDDGLYLCKANNKAGSASFIGHIQVQYPPDLFATVTKVRNWSNKPINLSCIANAIPNATFSWKFGDQDIRTGDQTYTIYNDEVGLSRLLIKSFTGRKVYGIYNCRASNSHGMRSVSIDFKEATVPEHPNVKLIETRPTALEFQMSDPISDLPIKYYHVKYGRESEADKNSSMLRWPAGRESYKLSGLSPRTRYGISFAAENDVGIGAYSEINRFDTRHETRPEKVTFLHGEHQNQDFKKNGFVRGEFGDQFRFQWDPVESNGRKVQYYTVAHYKVHKNGDKYIAPEEKLSEERISISSPLEHTLINLQPNTFYKIQLSATNEVGESAPSELIFQTSESVTSSGWSAGLDSFYDLGTVLLSIVFGMIILLIVMDMIFYIRCRVGVMYFLQGLFFGSDSGNNKKTKSDELPHPGNLGLISEVKRSSPKNELNNSAFDPSNVTIKVDESTPMMSVDESRGDIHDDHASNTGASGQAVDSAV